MKRSTKKTHPLRIKRSEAFLGIHFDFHAGMDCAEVVPREEMSEAAKLLRDTYAITPGAPFIQREFGYYCMENWAEQGTPQRVHA